MKKILFTITIVAIFLGYGIYEQVNKKTIKSKRVACQEKSITFEKIVDKKKVFESIQLIKTQNIKIVSDIEYSKIMKSNLINYYNEEDSVNDLKSVLAKYYVNEHKDSRSLVIDYYIYENDREDKGKKNKKAKLYSGYLVFEFKLDGKMIYKIQTDYMKDDGSDIKERMNCVFKSFTSITH